MEKMASIMSSFHAGLDEIAGMTVINTDDYSTGLNGLPPSDVLKFFFRGTDVEGSVVIRPSGTEPKLKAYLFSRGKDQEAAAAALAELEPLVSGLCK